jgi:serine/threonine protein kinase
MPLSAGDKLGSYEILAPLGAGGMGEVYRAHDSRLKRDVAIKVLPAALALDPDRMIVSIARHPNIGAIYGLEESNGTRSLVLALIEGPTLADPSRLVRSSSKKRFPSRSRSPRLSNTPTIAA